MIADVDELPSSELDADVFRIVAARYPQISLFERVASPEQWDILYAIEALTNQRLRDEVGDINLVAANDRVYGEGASWIMAAFTHPPKPGQGGRFNRDFGVYYCAPEQDTAIAETSYHRARFLRQARIQHTSFQMRVLRAHLGPTQLYDIRHIDDAAIYHLNDYSQSQELGAHLRRHDSRGLHYRSVRCEGECIAVMRPMVLSNAVHKSYLTYTFDNGAIIKIE